MSPDAKKIGVFGGTFDPPHVGHLALAEAALAQLGLDEVVFLPNNRNPLKQSHAPAAGRHRLEMVRLMIAGEPKFAVSDIDVTRRGPSYALDTMQDFTEVRPAEYWWLMGSDALRTFHEWRQPMRLLRLCRLGVALRPPTTVEQLEARVHPDILAKTDFISMPPNTVSSTEIRDRLSKGQTTLGTVARVVLEYVERHKLYRRTNA
ncbi:MAG: nicotinate-nucleotide adenylyltransferase [Fimbriimonadaceae bacterium]|nr:nicotinate-nucleotide adenylyltransferase [Fimbriimonadaceae bacterium]